MRIESKLSHLSENKAVVLVNGWHDEKNLSRRKKCFKLSEEIGCLPIELALAYVVNKNPNIFPLVGPRSVYESESCMKASLIALDDEQMNWLTS